MAGVLGLLLGVAPPASAQAATGLAAEYGPYLDSLMVAEDVPGLSFAFFSREGVLWEYVGGTRNTATRESVDPGTVFEAASISKVVFAVVVESLVRDGILDLSEPLVHRIDPVPGLGYDRRSALLTPEMLLSHQGGLPNWRSRINLEAGTYGELFEPDDTLRFVADPGLEYRYSGEGFVLLQRVIEQLTGESLGSLAAHQVFEPLEMDRTSFSFDSLARENYALGHSGDGQPNKFGLRATLASSTLHTTAADLGRFGAHLAREVSDGGDLAGLIEPRVTVVETDTARLSWGLGLGVLDTSGGRYIYHGGNNVIFIADFIYGIEDDLGYALLTNSANGAAMVRALEERVFGRRLGR